MYIRAQCGAQNMLSTWEAQTITKTVVTSKSRAGSLIGGILGYVDLLVFFCWVIPTLAALLRDVLQTSAH